MLIGIDASRAAVAARTGTEQYTVALLGALATVDRHNVYTLYFNRLPASLPALGTNFRLRAMPFPRLWTHLRLSVELLARPPATLFVPAHVLPFPGALRRGMRRVVTIHDLGYLRFPQAHPRAQRLYLRLSTRWSAAIADAIIVPSQATRRDLLRESRVAPERVHVVHHGVDARFRPPAAGEATAAMERYGIRAPYFLYVGTLQPRKNLAGLIDAYAQAYATYGSGLPRLVLAGKVGWLSQQLLARAGERGVAEAVVLPGYVADADLPALLGGALAFVYPSHYEGFGMPVLEAMACGTPVLTSNTSSLPEVAGRAGLLVDPEDTQAIARELARLATEPALREQLRERGLAHVQGWSWKHCAEQTLGILMASNCF